MARRDPEPDGDPRTGPGPGRRAFYGRRQGRRLRPGLKALLDDLLPQIAIPLPRDGGRLDPADLFDNPPVGPPAGPSAGPRAGPRTGFALEIGFGDRKSTRLNSSH
jgi:hypothetical protein